MSKRYKIGIWGASTATGHNDYEKYGWVNRLRDMFVDTVDPFDWFNLSVSGATSADILNRFETEIRHRRANVVVVSVGSNDSAQYITNDASWVSLEIYKENLKKIAKIAHQYAEQVVFVGFQKMDEKNLNPCPWNTDIRYTNSELQRYEEAMKKVAEQVGGHFISLFDVVDLDDLSDGVHPNAIGHQKIAKRVAQKLKEEVLV